jgi:hypothetical protein
MQAAGTAADMRGIFKGMKDTGVAGVELGPDRMVVRTSDGQKLLVAR